MVGLEHIQALTIVTVSIFMTRAQVQLCTAGEEQEPHNITLSCPAGAVIWSKDNNSLIVTCTANKCQVNPGFSGYNVSVSSSTSTLIIYSVARQSAGTYSCRAGIQNPSCDFRVYARPTSVSCQPAVFQADSVTVVCTGTRIFPNPVCKFRWTINGTESPSLQEQLIQVDSTEYGDPVYYNTSCSLKLPARNFSVGSHQFQVRVYPNVTGEDSDSAYGVDNGWSSQQFVVYPSVMLECRDASPYVEEGKPFSCTCKENANSFILAKTTLSYGSKKVNSTQNVTASFTANRTKEEIICETQLPDGTNVTTNKKIQVVYGPNPSSVALRVIYNQTESDVISLCDQSVTVTVTCRANDTSPGVNYQLSSNVTDTPAGLSNMSAVNYTVTRSGLFYFLCTANNSQFSSLSASKQKMIQVIAPPSTPVIEKDQDGGTPIMVTDQLTVPEGVARIRCRVEGGYPPVSGLLLECGSQTSRDNHVFMEVNISREMDGSSCSCTVTHNSSCYRNNKALTVLDVRFGPSIFNFEANNNSEQIILEQNSSVNFSCQAEGNPSPRLSVKKNGTELQMVNDSSHKFNLTLSYSNPKAECLDTGVYTCLAEAGQRTTNKTLAVYVKCKPQFRDSENLNKIHQQRVNGTVVINVPVFGYPEPNVSLSRNNYNLSSKDYNLTYIQLEPPYGNVSLVIKINSEQFFQNYTLHINNPEGALTYTFEIVDGDHVQGSGSNGTPGPDVGAIVGGIVAAVLVIVIIFVIVFLWRRKGAPCKGKKQQNGNALMDTPYGSDLSVNHHPGSGEAEVTIDNYALYHLGEKSMKSDEVTVDNSDLYNMNRRSDEVEVDNSDLYNLNRSVPGVTVRDSQYRNYSDLTPTITTASSLPLNMRNKKPDDASNPYEDVNSGGKSKPKPTAPQKPKPVAKPKPQPKNPAPDQTYAMVVKVPKSDKPFAIKEEKDEFFYDPDLKPEIPDKNYENPYEDTDSEKIKEKKPSERKKKNAGKPNGKASEQHKHPSSSGHTNSGFSDPEEEVNVYANT